MKDYNKEWRQRNPEKVRAHWAVSNAIRYGKLQRQPCEVCGETKSHAHHDDYNKPLDVKWLCHGCHWKRHGWVKPQLNYKYTSQDGKRSSWNSKIDQNIAKYRYSFVIVNCRRIN